MQITRLLSGIVVLSFCLFLFGLGIAMVFRPKSAEKFLMSYASSARAHYIEQILRMLVGTAIVIFAPSMWFSNVLNVFGWIIIITTVGLLIIPWQWHNKFGKWAIPLAIKYLKIYSVGAFGLGGFILYSLSRVLNQ
jgi:hypothetical protein